MIMPKLFYFPLLLIFLLLLNGCTTIPQGPGITALPGSNETLISFQEDDLRCRQQAKRQSGDQSPNQIKDKTIGDHAAVGTIVGALLGAAFGSGHNDVAFGAASGMILGVMSGSDEGYAAGHSLQHRYDNVYTLCMYTAGHRVPVKVKFIEQANKVSAPTPATTSVPSGVPYGVPPDFKQ
jgi:hypothetical protein